MIHLIILFFLTVLLDDHGHETLSIFGYIMSALALLFWLYWLYMTVRAAHDASES